MSAFRKAPEGQPTSNIELQLRVARDDEREWRVAAHHHRERLESAERMHKQTSHRVAELVYQLDQRKAANG